MFSHYFIDPNNNPVSVGLGIILILLVATLMVREAEICPNTAHSLQGCWGPPWGKPNGVKVGPSES